MDTLLMPEGLFAVGTAVAGVILFSLAPYLPSLFPHAFARFVGFGAVCAALVPLWVLSGSWQLPAVVGGCCLALMVLTHLLQTNRGKQQAELRK